MNKIINLKSLEDLARPKFTKMAFDFVAGGADDELTLAANKQRWQDIQLVPRVLKGTHERKMGTIVLGQPIAFPILVAPMGFQCLAHPDGEIAAAQGAAAADTIYVLSTTSTKSLEEVSRGSRGPKWFQLYVYKDRAITQNLVERAVAAGYQALCLTVDTPIEGRRERDKYNQFVLPKGLTIANFKDNPALKNVAASDHESALTTYIETQWETALSWKDVEWLASLSKLPLVLKGLVSPIDARMALDYGASALIVSNHGGRQLDGTISTVDALPPVIDAVQGRCEVLVDGGIRRGTDVLKALALGAKAVLLGRPVFWALALDGKNGVEEALCHLRDELSDAMELAGCPTLADVSKDLLWTDPRRS